VPQVAPDHRQDLTVARGTDVVGALNWVASVLNLPTLADSGNDGVGQGMETPIKQPAVGQVLVADNHVYFTTTAAGDTPLSTT
jgi:hypothetical protein